jgi:hypothetical protein
MSYICKNTCALGARAIRIKTSKVPKLYYRAPIWRTIKQLTQLKPTRHVTMKELYRSFWRSDMKLTSEKLSVIILLKSTQPYAGVTWRVPPACHIVTVSSKYNHHHFLGYVYCYRSCILTRPIRTRTSLAVRMISTLGIVWNSDKTRPYITKQGHCLRYID